MFGRVGAAGSSGRGGDPVRSVRGGRDGASDRGHPAGCRVAGADGAIGIAAGGTIQLAEDGLADAGSIPRSDGADAAASRARGGSEHNSPMRHTPGLFLLVSAAFAAAAPAVAQTGFPFQDEGLHYTVNWPSGLSLGDATLSAHHTANGWDFEIGLDAAVPGFAIKDIFKSSATRSEEHTSELQSPMYLV